MSLPSSATLAVLFAITGCGGDDSDGAGPEESASTTHKSASPSKSSAAPSSSPPRTKSPSPTKAADGTNLAACADGKCEVEIKVGDVIGAKGDSGREEFRVEGLGEEGLSVAIGPFDNPAYASLSGSGEINGVSLELTPLAGKRAILRVS